MLIAVLSEVRKRMPFPLLGFDTDNDSVFMNETVQSYCKEAGVEFTRCRPYRKNDQVWVERKNGAVVRRIVGYRRYVGLEAAAALGRLYMSVRLFVNFFQPSFELASKKRDGARVTKRYYPPATAYQRLLADPRTSETVRARLSALQAPLDPVRLLSEIRLAQKQLVEIADRPVTGEMVSVSAPTLEHRWLRVSGASLTNWYHSHIWTFWPAPLMLLTKPCPDAPYDKEPATDDDSRATLRAGVHRIYLPTPFDAPPRVEM